jgi:hypothetical protein
VPVGRTELMDAAGTAIPFTLQSSPAGAADVR